MLKAILIDDEENNISSLRLKLEKYCPNIEIIKACFSAMEGLAAIETLHPDVVFLDIEMPVMNGFVMLQQLSFKNFALIFVTAYDHYAIKAIRYSALDYLVKPVEIDDLKNAVQRASEKKVMSQTLMQMDVLLENMQPGKRNYKRLALPTNEGIVLIKTKDILYLIASVNYTHIYLVNKKKYILSRTLKDVEEVLDPDVFFRIHNSHIVNLDFVEKYFRGDGGQLLMADGATLDVSKRKKAGLLKLIGDLG